MSLLGLCSALLACSGRADIPDTPDLNYLQEEFESPTAELDQTRVLEAVREMPNLRQLAAAFRATGLSTTGGVNTAGGDTSSGSRLNIQGSIHVTVRCPGGLDVPEYGSNGTLSLTLGVQKNLIKRGITLDANACVLRGDAFGMPIRAVLDGPIYMDLGRDIGLRQRWSGGLLALVAGTLDVEGVTLENLAARWTSDRLEYLFRLPEKETWVIAVLTDDGELSIRDSKVTWGCSDGQTCSEL